MPALPVPARKRVRRCGPVSRRGLVPVRYVAAGGRVAVVAPLPAGVVRSVAVQAFLEATMARAVATPGETRSKTSDGRVLSSRNECAPGGWIDSGREQGPARWF